MKNGEEYVEEFGRLAMQLMGDLREGLVVWQLVVLVVALALAWQAARIARARLLQPADGGQPRFGMDGLCREVFPLTALVALLIGRAVLSHWRPVNLLDVAIPLMVAMAIIRAVVYLLRATLSPGGMLRTWEVAISWLVWGAVALHLTGLSPAVLRFLDETALQIGAQRISLSMVLTALLTIFISLFAALWIGRLIENRVMAMSHVDVNLRVVLTKILRSILIVIAVLIVLPIVGIDITVLSVFGGALGVGIGLGLQRVAANYISGITILLDRSISPGDVVTVDGVNGEVARLTSRCIIVRSSDGTNAIIPNETLITSKVINHSFARGRALVKVPVQVAYGTDLEQAMRILVETAVANADVLKEPRPSASISGFGENGVGLELMAWAENAAQKLPIQTALNLAIYRAFRESGIAMPAPRREVRLVGTLPSSPAPN